jgi:hypothetical protein
VIGRIERDSLLCNLADEVVAVGEASRDVGVGADDQVHREWYAKFDADLAGHRERGIGPALFGDEQIDVRICGRMTTRVGPNSTMRCGSKAAATRST